MMLIVIGELDKITDGTLLPQYSELEKLRIVNFIK